MLPGPPRSITPAAVLFALAACISLLPVAGASPNAPSIEFSLERKAAEFIGARAAAETKKISPVDLKYQNNNRDLLPAQICGIVGAYFLTVVAIGICLLTCGRRMRRGAQYGSSQIEVEMVKSPPGQYEPSMMSPASTSKSWVKRALGRDNKSVRSTSGNISAPVSPGMPGPGLQSFDQKLASDSREAQQRDLERLYEAVMEHDAKKVSSTTNVTAVDEEETNGAEDDIPFSPISPQFPQSPLTPRVQELPLPVAKPTDKRILSIRTGREGAVPQDMKSPLSPHTPANPLSPGVHMRPIYPPGSPGYAATQGLASPGFPQGPASPGYPQGPASPGYPQQPGTPGTPGYARRPPPTPSGQGLPASPRSFVSSQRASQASSVTSAATTVHSVKPATKATSKTRKALRSLRISSPIERTSQEEERQPLSPRLYAEPGPAPQPPTPHTGKSFASVTTTRTFITQDSDDEEQYERMQREALDRPQPLPRAAPQRGPTHPSNMDLRAQASINSLRSGGADASLPFRNQHPDAGVPATPVKTTYLESKPKGGVRAGPRTAGLTPMTGTVPMTPYSPYMPFTPVTPVTPHLLGKKEMKVRKKEERRRVMAKDEGDLVQDNKSMWGEEY